MSIYQLHISLDSITPLIWRRVIVKDQLNLTELHQIIQVLFNWSDSHLHQFEHDGVLIGDSEPENNFFVQDELSFNLADFCKGDKLIMTYEYDFGDSWKHTIKLEKVINGDDPLHNTICTDGDRNSPPEDCGGILGFQNLINTTKKLKPEELTEFITWQGKNYDLSFFDLARVNKRLKGIR